MEYKTVTYKSEFRLPWRFVAKAWLREKWLRIKLGKQGYANFCAAREQVQRELSDVFINGLGGKLRDSSPEVDYKSDAYTTPKGSES